MFRNFTKIVYPNLSCALFISFSRGWIYVGFDEREAKKVVEIVEKNIELVDPVLEEVVWELKEDVYHGTNSHSMNHFDTDRKVLDHVVYNYNLLRKKLRLPYDNAYFREKCRVFTENQKRRRKRIASIDNIRKKL